MHVVVQRGQFQQHVDCNADDRRGAVTLDRRRVVADAVVVLAGAALVASAFAHWVRRGTGSGLRGHALVDAIITVGRHLPGLSGARLTVLWYIVPAAGAASWIATGLRGAGSRATRMIAVCAAVAAGASAIAIGWLAGYSNLGPGAWLALFGAIGLVAGAWVVAPARRRVVVTTASRRAAWRGPRGGS